MILMGVGIIALLPLLAWLFSIINLVVGIGFLIFIALAIIALVYNLLNLKSATIIQYTIKGRFMSR